MATTDLNVAPLPTLTVPLPIPAGAYPVLTFGDASAGCLVHCAQHEEAEAGYVEFADANGESIRRRDRLTLGLRGARPAVTA